VEVRLPEGLSNRSEARNIVQAVTERMAFSLENARLFEQARLAAEREQQINAITARLQGLTSIEDILATAVSTLSEVLAADQGTIRLVSRNVMTDADLDQRTTLETRTDQGRDAPAMTG
jgi:GAF domain-containing protein